MNEIIFTPTKLRRLRVAYKRALEAGETQFVFDGHQLIVSYARFLIEYLETQLEEKPNG